MVPGSAATVKYGQNRVELDNIHLMSGGQRLDVNGAFALDPGARSGAIQAHASNVSIPQIETLMLQHYGLSGTLDGDTTISGSTAAPKVEGQIRVTNGGFQTYRYESLNANVTYEGTRVAIDATLRQSAAESITARG